MPTRQLPTPIARTAGSFKLRAAVLLADGAALALGYVLLLWVLDQFGQLIPPLTGRQVMIGLATTTAVGLLGLRASGAHERRLARVRRRELIATTKASAAPALLLLVLLSGQSLSMLATIGVLVGSSVLWSLLLAASRAAIAEWIRGLRARGHLQASVLVVGTGRARQISDFLEAHPHLGYAVADTVELLPESVDATLQLLGDLAQDTGVSGIVITDPGDPVVQPLLPALGRMGLHVHVASGVQGFELRSTVTSSMAGELFLDFSPNTTPEWEPALVRAADIVISTIVLTLTAPLWLLIAAAVKIVDGGPVLYVQERVGRHEQPFPMLKFRSMRQGADAIDMSDRDNGREGPLTKVADDPRVTAIGRIIRATSLDELPQLLNVLRGDMSIVGPRPALASEHVQFDDELRRRTEVRPGLTGLWQVEGRDLPSFELYRRLDLIYVDNFSTSLYFSVLLRTVTALVGHTTRSLLTGSEATLAPEEAHGLPDATGTIDLTEHVGNDARTWGAQD